MYTPDILCTSCINKEGFMEAGRGTQNSYNTKVEVEVA